MTLSINRRAAARCPVPAAPACSPLPPSSRPLPSDCTPSPNNCFRPKERQNVERYMPASPAPLNVNCVASQRAIVPASQSASAATCCALNSLPRLPLFQARSPVRGRRVRYHYSRRTLVHICFQLLPLSPSPFRRCSYRTRHEIELAGRPKVPDAQLRNMFSLLNTLQLKADQAAWRPSSGTKKHR
jgi:hypothetical protein